MLKKVKVEDSIGKRLLHDITGIREDGFKGVVFRRGHLVSKEDIDLLKSTGEEHIFVGELPKGYVHEEDAAMILSELVAGENIYLKGPSEGKVGLYAACDGVLEINSKALFDINYLGDYTLATKENYSEVKKDDYLCGLRIVPLYTTEKIVEEAKALAKRSFPVFDVKPYKKLKIGIIITGTEVYEGLIQDRFEEVLRKKLSRFDCEILGFEIVPDDLDKILKNIDNYLESGADIVLLTGGMSVDPDDLTPTAISKRSDEIIIKGVPIQPGNMLTIGKNKEAYLIGVPGATMHSDQTSFDIVLPRLFASIDIKKSDLIKLGEGGLI